MKIIFIMIIIALLSACSSSGKKAIDKLYYRFGEVVQTPIENQNIIVKRPTAMGIIGNRPMVAQNKNGALQQMHHSFWLDSPKILLHNYLQKIFIPTISTDRDKRILNSQILHFEKQQNIAIVAIKFSLIDSNNNTVFSKIYKQNKQLESNSIAAFAAAVNSILEDTVQQLVIDIQ